MRVLTIGPSPHLLARNGRIHRDIILESIKAGRHVESIVWHHDVEYFLPNEINKHFFQSVEIHPFLGEKGEIAPFAFEVMKSSQPKVVVTIGDYEEIDWVWAIKSIYPNLFKWVAVIPTGTDVVNEKNRLALSYADRIVVTTKTALKAFSAVRTEIEYVPYGPNHDVFHALEKPLPKELTLLNMGKNSQMANVPAFLKAVAETGYAASLHTNIDDEGDYDLRRLVQRYGISSKLHLPAKYASVREGLADSLVNELYNSHHVVVECSLEAPTALTMLEAMATGCVPVGMEFGAVGEVLAALPKEYRFSVPFETFVGPKEEELAVISVKELVRSIKNIDRSYLSDPDWMIDARRVMTDLAKRFSKEKFVTRVSEILEMVVTVDNFIAVDSF